MADAAGNAPRKLLHLHQNFRRSPDSVEQAQEFARGERDAACRGTPLGTHHMDEHGAASPGDPRPRVVVDLHDKVIEMIIPPEAVAAVTGSGAKRAIIAAVI